MYYKKLISDKTIIEFHNNWLGEETVIVNGQVVSKKSSVWGAHHYFSVMEDGHNVRYVLTTKVNAAMQVLIDLLRNGELLYEDVIIPYGSRPKKPKNTAKKKGMAHLQEYELNSAVKELKFALDIDPEDPEIFFHLACAYSILEKTPEGFECLKNAVEYRLPHTEMIFNHDMLAFLRMHEAFENFANSGFTEYDKKLIEENNEN